jgi:hypothetical protein
MERNHIHFAIGQYGSAVVISGMRSSAQVLIYLDVEAALKDGIPLFLSANKVVLSPGDSDGRIAPKYFKYVLNTKLEPFDPDFTVNIFLEAYFDSPGQTVKFYSFFCQRWKRGSSELYQYFHLSCKESHN